MQTPISVTPHYAYMPQVYFGPNRQDASVYAVYLGTLETGYRPVAVMHTESQAIGKCKCLELENYGTTK